MNALARLLKAGCWDTALRGYSPHYEEDNNLGVSVMLRALAEATSQTHAEGQHPPRRR